MTRNIKTILFVTVATLIVTTASLQAWTCKASSTTGWGIGVSSDKQTAISLAIDDCQRNSYQGICILERCW